MNTTNQSIGWTFSTPALESEHSTGKPWHPNGNGDTGLMDVLVDALIAGGSALFAVFVALPGVPDSAKLWAGFVAFGVTFFGSLAAARKRPKRRKRR